MMGNRAASAGGGAAQSRDAGDARSPAGRTGFLHLVFERRGPRTVLARRAFTLPLQAFDPIATVEDDVAVVPVLNPTGGLVGGDHLAISVSVGPKAHACLTTLCASPVYRTVGPAATQEIRLEVADGGVLEYVPRHTIPFGGSALHQSIEVTVGDGSRVILVDAFSAGRIARGESWAFARLESGIAVRDACGVIAVDRIALGASGGWAGLGFAEGASYVATVLAVGSSRDDRLSAGALAPFAPDGVSIGVSPFRRGGRIVRLLARSAPLLSDALAAVWAAARQDLLGRPALDLWRR